MFRVPRALLKKFRSDERGAILVEMTFITPLMLLLSAGVFEFGNLIHQKLLIETGIRDAARYAARCNSKLFADAGSAINCKANAEHIALYGSTDVGDARVAGFTVDVEVPPSEANCHQAVVGGVTQYHSATESVCAIRVTGSLTYNGVALLVLIDDLARFFRRDVEEISSITLTASHEERYIGW